MDCHQEALCLSTDKMGVYEGARMNQSSLQFMTECGKDEHLWVFLIFYVYECSCTHSIQFQPSLWRFSVFAKRGSIIKVFFFKVSFRLAQLLGRRGTYATIRMVKTSGKNLKVFFLHVIMRDLYM